MGFGRDMKNLPAIYLIAISLFASRCLADNVVKLAIVDLPPYAFFADNQADGITVSIVKEVFSRMQQPLSVELVPWSRALIYLESGEIDGLFEILEKEERKDYAEYSAEILMDESVSLFVVEDSNILFNGDLSQLKDYRFGVRQDFSYGSQFDQAVANKVLTKITRSVHPQQLLEMLYFQQIDILIGDKYSIPYLNKKIRAKIPSRINLYQNIKRLTPDVQSTPTYLAFSKKSKFTELRERFDRTLVEMKEDGTYARIIMKFITSYSP
jgi:polar amino acid transport system substrate-binding protein